MSEQEQQLAAVNGASGMDFNEIMAANAVKYELVPVWSPTGVGIMTITAGEVLEWLDDREGPRKREAGLLLVARSLARKASMDAPPERVCPTKEMQEQMVQALKDKDSHTVNRLIERIVVINGIVTTAEQAKNVSGGES